MLVSNSNVGIEAEKDRAARLNLQSLIHMMALVIFPMFRRAWWAADAQGLGHSAGTGLLDRQSLGEKAGIFLKRVLAILRDACLTLENLHIRFEDCGANGHLGWSSRPMCTGLMINRMTLTRSEGTGTAEARTCLWGF